MPDATLAVLEPATEAVLQEVPRAGEQEVDDAVAAAKAAFPGWRAVAPADRARLLRRLAERIDSAREELAQLEARNAGKPIGDARGEMGMVADTIGYYAGLPERMLGDTIPVAGGQAFTIREPLGVVGLIVPWNFPLVIAGWKLGPGAGRRQHGRAQAGRADAADRAALRAARARGRAARGRGQRRRRARARPAGRGSSPIPTWPRSPSPARPRSGARSPPARRRRSSGSRSSWAASPPTSCSPTPTSRRRPPRRPGAVFGNAGQDCCARSRILVQASVLDEFMGLLERGGDRDPASATRSTRRPRWGR